MIVIDKQYCASSTSKSPYVDIGATINWASSIDRRLSKELEGQLEIPKHQINKQNL